MNRGLSTPRMIQPTYQKTEMPQRKAREEGTLCSRQSAYSTLQIKYMTQEGQSQWKMLAFGVLEGGWRPGRRGIGAMEFARRHGKLWGSGKGGPTVLASEHRPVTSILNPPTPFLRIWQCNSF